MAIGGLDVGSTGAKITVLDDDGRQLYTGYRDYPVARGAGAHEIDLTRLWEAVRSLLREAVAAAPEMTAIGIISFGESFALLDEGGEVLFPAMLYTDPRGGREAALLREKLGDGFISATAGVAAHPMYSLPKLMWVRRNRPDLFAQAKYVCLIGDFLVYKLTGNRIIDYPLASRTMGLDIHKKEWSREIFAAAGIDPALFSRPVPPGTDAGAILPGMAGELGLPKDLRVVLCCHDQVAAAIGSGVSRPGQATDGGGSVQCITPVFSRVPEDSSLQANHYPIVPFLGEDYCCYAFSFTGGALVKWFVDNFAARYQMEAKEKGDTVYRLLEEQMRDEPTGILVLPHFAGAATPYMDTGSKGALVGLELSHTPVEVFRAIMEGITFEMRLNMEKLAEGGIQIHRLNATGGCARSRLWLQMKADILGVPVARMGVDEAGTVGGIMLTGVATGVYPSLENAAGRLVQTLEIYHPRREAREQYEGHYRRYLGLYGAVRPLV